MNDRAEPHQPFEEALDLHLPKEMAKLVDVELEEHEREDGSGTFVEKNYSSSALASDLMRANDEQDFTEAEREKKISELFAKINVEVSFVG